MSANPVEKAANQARDLLRDRQDVGSVGISRGNNGDLCVRVDIEPGADKALIRKLLASIRVPVVVRIVSGVLRAH